MKLKKLAVRGLIIFAVVVALCMFFSGTIRTITTAKVKILTPRQGRFSQQVELTGKVVFPEAEAVKLDNAQDVSLSVTSVKVQAGSEVAAGDVLFTAEIADYDKTMDTLRTSYNEAAAQLAEVERKNANLRLRPTDEAWAEAYQTLSAAQAAELECRINRDALMAVEGFSGMDGAFLENASEELRAAWAAHLQAAAALTAAENAMESAERYNISDDVRTYITDRQKYQAQMEDYEQQMVDLRVLRTTLQSVTAPEAGYITEVNVKAGDTFDPSGAAYSFCPADRPPVLRVDTSETKLTISRGPDVSFDSVRGGTVEGSVASTGVTAAGDTYADVELTDRMIRDLGGSVAMLASEFTVRVSYRSNDTTTLLPSSAVRGAGDERYVYVLQQRQSAFGVNSLVTQKQDVTVLAEAGGQVSVAEDLSYMQIAYMEDREISENMTVMEYVN